jgi:hypothetical protein
MRPVGDAVTVVSIAFVIANGVPSMTVNVSKLDEVEYTKPFRELFAPALTTDVNFTEVLVTNEVAAEIILGITELTRPVITFPRVLPDALLASKRM